MDHFAIFSITRSYKIDLKNLEKKYLDLQSKYHPDMARNEDEMDEFLKISVFVNDAYKILKNDHSRAILMLKAVDINPTEIKSSSDFLELMLEKSEFLDEARTKEDVDEFTRSLESQYLSTKMNLESAFERKEYELAQKRAIELKYLENILNKARNKRYDTFDRNI
ncbi:MAG: Fe-S protein assembly co-chaperone HscB [Rickettsiaceae bacterium]|nr:Fe-S protein assembly co-chaperone HscB [Rickettsiaceae bacterium]